MGGLIEAVLAGSLVGVFTLLGVYLAGWQERKRAREAHEARKKEMVYAKQLEVLEEAIKWLTLTHIQWRKFIANYEERLADGVSEERLAVLEGVGNVITQSMSDIIRRSAPMTAKMRTYLSLETEEVFQEYVASVKGVEEGFLRGENEDFEGTRVRLGVAYKATVSEMRGHLGIRESVGGGKATRIGGRRRLKLKFWASGRSRKPTSRPKSPSIEY